MANTIPSANMNLPIPVPGVDAGPDYALNINAALAIIDAHDHSAGNGVQITPSGLDINSDLTFNSNNLTNARSVRFTPQSAVLNGASDLGCLYENGVDLYYNDGNGNHVRITQSGGVAGSPGSIANLASPASATYVSGDQTFVWQSAANTPANSDGGSVILRNITASSKGLTLNPPNAMGADYSLTLPSLPSATRLLSIDTSGNIGTTYQGKAPTVQRLTSGSGTYTTPAGPAPLYLRVQMVGSGGGGAGDSISGGSLGSNGDDGEDSTFGTSFLIAAKGLKGHAGASNAVGGDGGTSTVNAGADTIFSQHGSIGQSSRIQLGGSGGSSFFGNSVSGGLANYAPGAGGSGATPSTAANIGGGGGGAGGYIEVFISTISASYSYTVGSGGDGGNGQSQAGSDGADGLIVVTEYYQ